MNIALMFILFGIGYLVMFILFLILFGLLSRIFLEPKVERLHEDITNGVIS